MHDIEKQEEQKRPLFSLDTPGAGYDEGVIDPEAEEAALKEKQDGNE